MAGLGVQELFREHVIARDREGVLERKGVGKREGRTEGECVLCLLYLFSKFVWHRGYCQDHTRICTIASS